tara:strand:+ start:275 stop:427 length:153 start_codon:yes stop_codon:yes gene_type:complete
MKKEILISKSKNGMAQYVIHHYQEGLKNKKGEPYKTSTTVHKRYSGDKKD